MCCLGLCVTMECVLPWAVFVVAIKVLAIMSVCRIPPCHAHEHTGAV